MKGKSDVRVRLAEEVDAFKAWATRTFPEGPKFGEWEFDYPGWDRLHSAVTSHLDTYTPGEWDVQDVDMLLYSLARDNEGEIIKSELEQRPDHLHSLATLALTRTCDWEARWQLADALSTWPNAEAGRTLERYFRDQHEYVRRRALLALAKIDSPKGEEFALEAWGTDDQYHRMCALSALYKLKSPLLPQFLSLAEQDGRRYLVQCVERIKAGEAFERL